MLLPENKEEEEDDILLGKGRVVVDVGNVEVEVDVEEVEDLRPTFLILTREACGCNCICVDAGSEEVVV